MNKSHFYVIASGSNRRHFRYGTPEKIVREAHHELERHPAINLIAEAPVIATAAMGPAKRRFANSAIWIASTLTPPELLVLIKNVEREFGRKRGRRWGDRVLDLDIILWSGGTWKGRNLAIPHREFRDRSFVLKPLVKIVPDWHDPVMKRSVRQLVHTLDRPRRRH